MNRYQNQGFGMTVSQKATLYLVGVTRTKSKICIGAKES